jgi:hypothetical protein
MGRCLTNHRAGQSIEVSPNEFLRRETDRSIHRRLGKRLLDVGADRIARTAHADQQERMAWTLIRNLHLLVPEILTGSLPEILATPT